MNLAMAITFGLAHRLDKTTVKGLLVLRQPSLRINYRYASFSSQEVLKRIYFILKSVLKTLLYIVLRLRPSLEKCCKILVQCESWETSL